MSKKAVHNPDVDTVLAGYKQKIDSDIESYSKELVAKAQNEFGDLPSEVLGAYVAILSRGGKRLRGTLAMMSYEIFGGTDQKVALTIARVVEMLHAHILIIDDIQDSSLLRRGDKSAHVLLGDVYGPKLGEGLAINSSLVGLHIAIEQLTKVPLSETVKLKAIQNVTQHFIVTVHGQTLDLIHATLPEVKESEIENMMLWKTAHYSFMNPMQLGAILAGAIEQQMTFMYEFSVHAGKAFQLRDDIAGVFGDPAQTGKTAGEDIEEGKKSLLLQKALELGTTEEREYIFAVLGKKDLSKEQLDQCRKIIIKCGALELIEKSIIKSVSLSKKIIEKNTVGLKYTQILNKILDTQLPRN